MPGVHRGLPRRGKRPRISWSLLLPAPAPQARQLPDWRRPTQTSRRRCQRPTCGPARQRVLSTHPTAELRPQPGNLPEGPPAVLPAPWSPPAAPAGDRGGWAGPRRKDGTNSAAWTLGTKGLALTLSCRLKAAQRFSRWASATAVMEPPPPPQGPGPGASISVWSQQSGAESLLLLLPPPPPPPPPPLLGSMIGGAVCVVKRGREMEAGAADRGGAGRTDPGRTARLGSWRPTTHLPASRAADTVRTVHSRPGRQRLNLPRVCVRKDLLPPNANYRRRPHRQPHVWRELTSRYHPYLRLGSSRLCPPAFPPTKRGR